MTLTLADMLYKMRRKMKNKAKMRAANAARELKHLGKSSTKSEWHHGSDPCDA